MIHSSYRGDFFKRFDVNFRVHVQLHKQKETEKNRGKNEKERKIGIGREMQQLHAQNVFQ